jgi:hypothetical protein
MPNPVIGIFDLRNTERAELHTALKNEMKNTQHSCGRKSEKSEQNRKNSRELLAQNRLDLRAIYKSGSGYYVPLKSV